MTIFVHVADERDAGAIRRNGLKLPKARWRDWENANYKWGVFAMPVIEDFMLTHQWVREMKRRGHRGAIGIYFRLPDAEPVWAGRFGQAKAQITAAQAAARLRNERLLGYEVIIPRGIAAAEITAIRPLPAVGWRHSPEAKGNPPRCLCRYCVGGDINSRKLRTRLDPEGRYT